MIKPTCESSALVDRYLFREALVSWFLIHGKDYPWRRTTVPYEIWVSEVMLQQTQITTVLGKGYYHRFLAKFPDVQKLAAAEDPDLLKAWEGLGYYRRVRMLRDTARALMENHAGVFPQDLPDLLKLPGIGRYTAGALRAFAFGLPAVLVDGNVARVLARLMDFSGPVNESSGAQQIWSWAENLACDDRPRTYHAALMELGQSHCRPGLPDCLNCPVATFCQTKSPETLPVKARKTTITAVDEHALWLRDPLGRVLLHHEAGKRRTGLWRLPVFTPKSGEKLTVLLESLYSITRYRVTLRVYEGLGISGFQPSPGDVWVEPGKINEFALAAPFRRAIKRILEDS